MLFIGEGFPGGTVVKNPPANARDTRDPGSIPGSGRSPGEGNGHPLQYSCLAIPWTEEPSRLQSRGSQRAGHDWECACTHTHTHTHTHSFTEEVCQPCLEQIRGDLRVPVHQWKGVRKVACPCHPCHGIGLMGMGMPFWKQTLSGPLEYLLITRNIDTGGSFWFWRPSPFALAFPFLLGRVEEEKLELCTFFFSFLLIIQQVFKPPWLLSGYWWCVYIFKTLPTGPKLAPWHMS